MIPHLYILIAAPKADGYAPIDIDYNGQIRDFDRAAIRPTDLSVGDYIALSQLTPEDRMALSPSRPLVPVGHLYHFTLTSQPTQFTIKSTVWEVRRYDIVSRSIATVLLLAAATLLVIREPFSSFTDVFLICFAFSPMALNAQLDASPSPHVWLINVVIMDAITVLGTMATLHFCATFLPKYRSGFRRLCSWGALVMSLPFSILWLWPDFFELSRGWRTERVNDLGYAVQGLIFLIACALLLQLTLNTKTAHERRVSLAALLAFVVGLGLNYIASVYKYSSLLPPIPESADDVLQTCSLALFFVVVVGILTTRATNEERHLRRIAVVLVLQASVIIAFTLFQEKIQHLVPPSWHLDDTVVDISLSMLIGLILQPPVDSLVDHIAQTVRKSDADVHPEQLLPAP